LRAFLAVASAGSVAGAAELLGLTQPSVSARLAGLERGWGARLFRRHARGMALTPEGAALLPLAEAALRGLAELDRAAGRPLAPPRELRVGAGDALGRERLPRALARLLRGRPELEVQLREGPGPDLLDALRDGEIDLALVVTPLPESKGDSIDLAPCLASEVALLVPDGGVPARRRSLRIEELAGRRVVALQRGSGFRRHVESIFAAAGLEFRPAVEVGNLSLVRRFVAAGLGVAPVPAVAFSPRDRFRGVRTLRFTGAPPVAYHRAIRAGAPLSATAHQLLELLAD